MVADEESKIGEENFDQIPISETQSLQLVPEVEDSGQDADFDGF